MKLIRLTQDKVTKVDNDDLGWLSVNIWYAVKSKRGYYAARSVEGHKSIAMHREIEGVEPGRHVIHINGDLLDNRRSNLLLSS